MFFFYVTFIQSNSANCQNLTYAQVIPTFVTPQGPTEDEYTNDFAKKRGVSTLKGENFENGKHFINHT